MASPLDLVRPEGSLGLLALGYRGLDAWREARGTDWIEKNRAHFEALRPSKPAAPKETYEGIEILIVSGLPRSGTSMAMQMLTAGGFDAFTDAVREADESNPKGYYEHDRVKASASDVSWIRDARGLVVKVVAPLLPFLPPGPSYKVVFMDRNVDEILSSQTAMLTREGRPIGDSERIRMAYANMLEHAFAWADGPAAPELLRLRYRDAIDAPLDAAHRLATFLDLADTAAVDMATIIDPTLHRQKA